MTAAEAEAGRLKDVAAQPRILVSEAAAAIRRHATAGGDVLAGQRPAAGKPNPYTAEKAGGCTLL